MPIELIALTVFVAVCMLTVGAVSIVSDRKSAGQRHLIAVTAPAASGGMRLESETETNATLRLAQSLVEITPQGLDHVFFSDDGATAVEVALKMAFQYWQQRDDPRPQKTCYLALDDAYHGDTLGSVSVGGVERFRRMFAPLLFDTVRLPVPNPYRLPPGVNRETACDYFLGRLEETLAAEHERIAALVIEPLVQAAAGMIVHPAGFLSGVRDLTRRYDVLLIADEVAVGFGRTGTMFACQQEDVSPDFLCLAKGITGGYLPLAATLATGDIWRAFLGDYSEAKTFYHGHTYGGNPLGAAVALASLDVFREERTLENMPKKVERLQQHLSRMAELPHVGDVRQRGLIAAVELVEDRETKRPFPASDRKGHKVCLEARRLGVFLRPLGDVIVIMPPLSITLEELDQVALAARQGIISATHEPSPDCS